VEVLTPESQKTLEERREDMLTQAKKCFNEALSKPDNDEPWLQYYMLGKIVEKMCKPPDEYLESYLKVKYECIVLDMCCSKEIGFCLNVPSGNQGSYGSWKTWKVMEFQYSKIHKLI
jgi:hypothetical protein